MSSNSWVTLRVLSSNVSSQVEVSLIANKQYCHGIMFTHSFRTISLTKSRLLIPHESDVVVKYLHGYHAKFTSVIDIHAKLVQELKDKVPDSLTFNVGYYEGQQHAKMVIVCDDDIKAMYQRYPNGDISLWCDGVAPETTPPKSGKRKRAENGTNFQEQKDDLEQIYQELQEKHSDKYDVSKLRLWARMIASNVHKSVETPPAVQFFSAGQPQKNTQQDTLSSALGDAAVAVVEALGGRNSTPCRERTAMQVDLRMKNLQQLGYLKQLYDDNILTKEEFTEQKENILSAIRKL